METLPTKVDYFSNSLAVIDSNHKKITINSRSIALEMGKRNGDINKKIRYLIKKGLVDAGNLSPTYYVDSSNRKQKSYDLDEETACILITKSAQNCMGFLPRNCTGFLPNYFYTKKQPPLAMAYLVAIIEKASTRARAPSNIYVSPLKG